jgi:hypothetical protein
MLKVMQFALIAYETVEDPDGSLVSLSQCLK